MHVGVPAADADRVAEKMVGTSCGVVGSSTWFACLVLLAIRHVIVIFLKHGLTFCRHVAGILSNTEGSAVVKCLVPKAEGEIGLDPSVAVLYIVGASVLVALLDAELVRGLLRSTGISEVSIPVEEAVEEEGVLSSVAVGGGNGVSR